MAETNLLLGEALPTPNPLISDPEADIEEPIHLLVVASTKATITPEAMTA
jgi:hypothetical protein